MQHIYENINAPERIYILGTGSIGKFVAHAVRGVPNPPPVTLLYHRPTFKDAFEKAGRVIKLTTGHNTEERSGYDVELALPKRQGPGQNVEIPLVEEQIGEAETTARPIDNLIVTVKAPDTVSALKPILHRLSPESTILFLQNGMGIVEECNEKLFPDASARPAYVLGVNSHGVHATSAFEATHAGAGTIMLGMVPQVPLAQASHADDKAASLWNPSTRYLMRALTRVPVLAAVALSPTELLQSQVEKLAINCLVNPLTVMMDCRNADLLHNFAISRTMFLLLAEISLIIQSLPELQGIPNIKLRFSPERLQNLTVNVAQKTGENISSMLQDVRRGSRTEIEYINGYIVKRGEAMGIKAVMNYMLMQMVIGKQQLVSKEIDNYSPFAARRRRRSRDDENERMSDAT